MAIEQKSRANTNVQGAHLQLCSCSIVVENAQKPYKIIYVSMVMVNNSMFLYGFRAQLELSALYNAIM